MNRDACLPGQVAEQAPVRGGEVFLTGARTQYEPSDRLTTVDERKVDRSLRRLASACDRLEQAVTFDLYGRIRQFQGLATVSATAGSMAPGASVASRRCPRRERTA